MATMAVSLPDTMKEFVDAQAEIGDFDSSEDYVRELIRRDQEARLAEPRRVVDEADASGISTRTLEQRIAEGDRILSVRR